MQTLLLRADSADFIKTGIPLAASLLKNGGLVAIPTETVYGLAANALDAGAVERIFRAKGRPQDNPLIVHLAEAGWLKTYALEIPPAAEALVEAFWPGPLTIILKKKPVIPDAVTAGLGCAAFRMPAHPVALKVIAAAGVPLAAPSANLSGCPSPTNASHVLRDLDGRIDAVIDGGECWVGVESTVVTLCSKVPTVLRPGGVTPEQLRRVIGEVAVDRAVTEGLPEGSQAASPGMKYRHYAPKTRLVIIRGDFEHFRDYVKDKTGAAALCFDGEEGKLPLPCVAYGPQEDAASQARKLFGALRRLDTLGANVAFARCPDEYGVGLAVFNRLLRAASFEIIEL